MIEPKGKLTKMLSSNSVDEAVETMLESPLMDLMAAMVLSGIKVSGMVENEIFANVTQDATNTAFIKAAMLLDLDGIMSKVTSTVSELVTKVTDETKKAG
jgi:beta-mannanase